MAGDKSTEVWSQYGSVHMKWLLKTVEQDLLVLVRNDITNISGSKLIGLSATALSQLG